MPDTVIDLRSDTVTRPTPAMLDVMTNAPVGDDVYGEDPTVNLLEQKAADLFGMEAALFCTSGTMTNQIAIKVHTRPGDDVICHQLAHIYLYEGGGMMANSGVSVSLVGDENGSLTVAEIEAALHGPDIHLPPSRLVALENTSNKGGGTCLDMQVMESIGALTKREGLSFHLDGARVFNAIVARQESPMAYGQLFDSISICLSKGLGCPVGSLVLGSRDFIREARRVRKRFGGGWRQAGFLAGAGIYALDNHVERLADDHRRANRLGECLSSLDYVDAVHPVETNIVIFKLKDPQRAEQFVNAMKAQHILLNPMGLGLLRLVTHLELSDEDIERTCDVMSSLKL